MTAALPVKEVGTLTRQCGWWVWTVTPLGLAYWYGSTPEEAVRAAAAGKVVRLESASVISRHVPERVIGD
jgi:hypothetical protein